MLCHKLYMWWVFYYVKCSKYDLLQTFDDEIYKHIPLGFLTGLASMWSISSLTQLFSLGKGAQSFLPFFVTNLWKFIHI